MYDIIAKYFLLPTFGTPVIQLHLAITDTLGEGNSILSVN